MAWTPHALWVELVVLWVDSPNRTALLFSSFSSPAIVLSSSDGDRVWLRKGFV